MKNLPAEKFFKQVQSDKILHTFLGGKNGKN